MSEFASYHPPGGEVRPVASPLPAQTEHRSQVNSTSTNELLNAVDKLKFFLATAPGSFDQNALEQPGAAKEERCFNRFALPNGDLVSCVLWNGLYHITGTDIVRALSFRFMAFGRPVQHVKKFEEGIFSDLRNLKSGTDATLEDPKSDFLELLFKYNAIRTQKKQKVFYWFSVPHDRLFLDALDRDLKREKLGMEPTTHAISEPATSFVYNPGKSLYEQFAQTKSTPDCLSHSAASLTNEISSQDSSNLMHLREIATSTTRKRQRSEEETNRPIDGVAGSGGQQGNPVFGALTLFEGSPAYKQRRKPVGNRVRRHNSAERDMSESMSPGLETQEDRRCLPASDAASQLYQSSTSHERPSATFRNISAHLSGHDDNRHSMPYFTTPHSGQFYHLPLTAQMTAQGGASLHPRNMEEDARYQSRFPNLNLSSANIWSSPMPYYCSADRSRLTSGSPVPALATLPPPPQLISYQQSQRGMSVGLPEQRALEQDSRRYRSATPTISRHHMYAQSLADISAAVPSFTPDSGANITSLPFHASVRSTDLPQPDGRSHRAEEFADG